MSTIAIRDQTVAHVSDVDSIGNAVFLAGSPRYASPGARKGQGPHPGRRRRTPCVFPGSGSAR